MTPRWLVASVLMVAVTWSSPATATPFFFSTGSPDGLIATASRPESPGKIEIESADDFVVSGANTLTLTSATFQGLLPSGAPLSSVANVRVEIYRVFPNDSANPPSGNVPTRVNSPSDVAFASRESAAGDLTFTPGIVNSSFTAAKSVLNGIHPLPSQTTGGEGPVTGEQVQFNVVFSTPFTLPADHYFFVPQVQLTSGDFFWLSAPRPIVSPGTPFPAGTTDLQSWIRNGDLDPNWLRIGMDIVGGSPAPTFNATFTLSGESVPVSEPSTLLLLGSGLTGLCGLRWRRRRQYSFSAPSIRPPEPRAVACAPTRRPLRSWGSASPTSRRSG
ncbi:MAG: PEP-CTERM sorting domain-containing protein [Candidatus Rokuibacteriota bacterium]|nr:MAG: PEP-CTERM sorting domain-containing protein [Candidatus Rokubacteria bacterium]